jgi:NAD-dependent dihydropyrimidine dehydrogenase PreA subunit
VVDLLKTVIQTIFRLFPFPTRTGLRVIGHPGPDAPVFVTCNFDLTVRRVIKELQGLDCYLLVAPSKGINVWCAAGGGMFNAHSVTSVLKTSRIAEKVNHRTLILPQLSAPGIDVARVRKETGWRCRFGPVYARDIPAYVAANFKKTDEMRRARFDLGDRLEMAVMWAGMLSFFVGIPVAVVSLKTLPGVLALLWSFTLFLFAFYEPVMRFVPGPVSLVKTLVLGLVGVVGLAVYGLAMSDWSVGSIVGWSLGVLAVAVVLGFDLDGTSPLRAGSTVTYWSQKWPGILNIWAKIGYEIEPFFTLQVDADRCRGCVTCVEVCPKNVFELYRLNGGQKSRLARMDECEQCTACVKQCPEGAILAEPPIKTFAVSAPVAAEEWAQ